MRHTSDGRGRGIRDWRPTGLGVVTVRFLMDDYVRHLQHHLGQIGTFAGATAVAAAHGAAGHRSRCPDA